ncbi:DUF2937 family protein [Celerinatantimonas sp. YJH-8]|uniref:DUF2937 family protein n=1 Tax=Celerinatantimonas sp. YJH-8 TaxID=3228714 RepID=UPI0038BECE07
MKFLANLFDRLLFIAVFLIAMQLPHFIDLYQQRLEGFAQATQQQLDQFQQMAQQQQQPSLDLFIEQMLASDDAAARQTGQLIEQTNQQNTQLQKAVVALDSSNLFAQVWAVIRYLKPDLISATLKQYHSAITLTLPALSCGLIAAVIVSLLKWLLFSGFRRRRHSFRPGPNPLR